MAERGPAPVTPSATEALVLDLFSRLDSEFAKLNAGDEKTRRDIFGRLTRKTTLGVDLPAAVRHNLNLILACVG